MSALVEHTGTARLGKRTKELVRRLQPDDIAVIDHTDLDRVSAEELVESGVRVVVNVAPSQSGSYPNPGPLQLVRGGVRLIDVDDPDLFDELLRRDAVDVGVIDDGDVVRVQPAHELLRPLAEACSTGVLDQAHRIIATWR